MDRKSEVRRTETRKAKEELLDQIREALADREERLRGEIAETTDPEDEIYLYQRLEELEAVGEGIAKIADREGLRWGEATEGEETEAFLDGFDDLPETDVDPDPDAPIPCRLGDGGAA